MLCSKSWIDYAKISWRIIFLTFNLCRVDIFRFSGFSPSAWYCVTPPKFAPISKCYTLMWVGAPQPALKLIWKNFMISLKAFEKSMKAIACIWVVGMWYNIIAYRMLCAYLPLYRLWIWWAFCTGIAAAIVSIARAAAASKNPRAFATPSQVVFSPLLLLHHSDAIAKFFQCNLAMPSSRKVASISNY